MFSFALKNISGMSDFELHLGFIVRFLGRGKIPSILTSLSWKYDAYLLEDNPEDEEELDFFFKFDVSEDSGLEGWTFSSETSFVRSDELSFVDSTTVSASLNDFLWFLSASIF